VIPNVFTVETVLVTPVAEKTLLTVPRIVDRVVFPIALNNAISMIVTGITLAELGKANMRNAVMTLA